jgi:uncharacterized membrane protein
MSLIGELTMLLNGPQIHLMLNHLPVVGFFFMAALMLLVTVKCSREYRRLALVGTFAVSLMSLAAYFTGEPAEEGIEDLPGVQEIYIHAHEEAAEVALILAIVTGVLAGASWVLTRKSDRLLGVAMPLVSVACIATAGAMSWTGHEGGKIRHPEIRDASGASLGGTESQAPGQEKSSQEQVGEGSGDE